MLKFIDHAKMGRGQHGWLDSHFHFSFAEYCNPNNVQFGALRVLNDDMVEAGEGFGIHPHRNMEIISYVVCGELTHGDSMGNKRTLSRGGVQYMSAGTGVYHSEMNEAKTPLRFLQIWILPDNHGYEPAYGDYPFEFEARRDRWLPIATCFENSKCDAPIKVHQDINMFATILTAGKSIDFEVREGRQVYLVMIDGSAKIAGKSDSIALHTRDAAEIAQESFTIEPETESHLIAIEMQKA